MRGRQNPRNVSSYNFDQRQDQKISKIVLFLLSSLPDKLKEVANTLLKSVDKSKISVLNAGISKNQICKAG